MFLKSEKIDIEFTSFFLSFTSERIRNRICHSDRMESEDEKKNKPKITIEVTYFIIYLRPSTLVEHFSLFVSKDRERCKKDWGKKYQRFGVVHSEKLKSIWPHALRGKIE